VTEEEAIYWLQARLDVPRETFERLEAFVALLIAETCNQNLIAASTLSLIWSRHVVDSAQLLPLAPPSGPWVDLGTGAGFPGLIVAILSQRDVVLVESRPRRSQFLSSVIEKLDLGSRCTVAAARAEAVPARAFAVISARAFAPLDRLLDIGTRFADDETHWLLPKGRNAKAELDAVLGTWQGSFRIEPSVTDPDSAIIVAGQVRRRRQR